MRQFFLFVASCCVLALSPNTLVLASPASSEAEVRHVTNRLSFGPKPGEIMQVMAIGVDAYTDQQLPPENQPVPTELCDRLAGLDTLQASQRSLTERFRAAMRASKE